MAQSSFSEIKFILDSSSLIDGRVVNLFENDILIGKTYVPRISYELARENSSGRNSMATLQKLNCGLSIQPGGKGINEFDDVVDIGKKLGARLITTSDDLSGKAKSKGLSVINIKEILKFLLPRTTPGDMIRVRIVKRGKVPDEGVGYLSFGVKVVVNQAGDRIGKEVAAIVKNSLTTPSGMILFAELA